MEENSKCEVRVSTGSELEDLVPSSATYGIGQDVGFFTIEPDRIRLTLFIENNKTFMEDAVEVEIDPSSDVLFAMVSRRLNSLRTEDARS